MNTTIKALTIAAVATLSVGATAAHAATATATAKAKILKQVSVAQKADLNFGTIVTGTGASTVVVTPAGARTCGAGLVCTGTPVAALFEIVGTVDQVVTLVAPASVALTATGGGSMTVTLNNPTATRKLTGTDSFTVGGTLNVGAAQADGEYSGTFDVTVNYQ